ncbi:MAG: hypothetical protein MK008_10865 [Bdellovibrionales bacterium]|nr:hypothetical protein [Bdellovibrionales bacterium]
MKKENIISMMSTILEKQGKKPEAINDNDSLRDISFRSLDFSELCLKVEDEIGQELNFEAANLRKIETVDDVCQFVMKAMES